MQLCILGGNEISLNKWKMLARLVIVRSLNRPAISIFPGAKADARSLVFYPRDIRRRFGLTKVSPTAIISFQNVCLALMWGIQVKQDIAFFRGGGSEKNNYINFLFGYHKYLYVLYGEGKATNIIQRVE